MGDTEWRDEFARRASQPEALAHLRDKYATLIRLRTERRAHPHGEPPRAALRQLAAVFPGALRELELRTDADLARRHDLLSRTLVDGAVIPAWAPPQVVFHGVLRVSLGLKRVMSAAADPVAVAHDHLASLPSTVGSPPSAFWSRARLDLIGRPKGGRLSSLILDWTAEIFELSAPDTRKAVLP